MACLGIIQECFVYSDIFQNNSGETDLSEASKERKKSETTVERWILNGKNKGLRTASLALGVQELVRADLKVMDKATDKPRPIRIEDIAILARTHNNVAEIAEAFFSIGIPVQIERAGLLDTPEGCLSLS